VGSIYEKKSRINNISKDCVVEMELEHWEIPIAFRMYNGGACGSPDLGRFFELEAIIYEFTCSDFAKYNRVAKDLNHAAGDVCTAWYVSASTSDKKLQAETVSSSISMKHHQPHTVPQAVRS
jgi:hypothetical protein